MSTIVTAAAAATVSMTTTMIRLAMIVKSYDLPAGMLNYFLADKNGMPLS